MVDRSTAIAAIDDAPLAILAWVGADGRPRACTVTPYVLDDHLVITSTYAYLAKVTAIRRDPRVAVLVAGVEVRGEAHVSDATPAELDVLLRQEVRKFPPTRSLAAVPGHRCLFAWYFARVAIRIPLADAGVRPHAGAAALVSIAAGEGPVFSDHVAGAPALELDHAEDEHMTDLRQRVRHGHLRHVGGQQLELVVEREVGSLDPAPRRWVGRATADDLCRLAELRQRARAARRRARADA